VLQAVEAAFVEKSVLTFYHVTGLVSVSARQVFFCIAK